MGGLVAVTLTDITLLKSKERSFRLLFEANPVPMWVHCAKSLKFLAVNDAALAQYGYTEEAFLRMNLLDIVPPDPGCSYGRDSQQCECEWRHRPVFAAYQGGRELN
jgi:PAS domain S-box-containing protein